MTKRKKDCSKPEQSEWFSTCWQEDMTAMVLRDRNHPSIIMWSVGNEVREQLVPQGWNIAKELVGLCHSLDPFRPPPRPATR